MRYRALLLKLISDVRASYWFIPSCLVVAAFLLAQICLWIDESDVALSDWLPKTLIDTQLEGARSTLSVIAQSVIGVTGVMFSVTMVAVSFASGNFGPRLIGNFMRDRGNQWSLGILIATFVYSLIILRSLNGQVSDDVQAFVPQVSLIVAMALSFTSIFVMIYFVHHVPETINVANISAGLGHRFRDELVRTAHGRAAHAELAISGTPVSLGRIGYVQRVEMDRLDKLAGEYDLKIRVDADPGTFLHAHKPALHVEGDCSDDLTGALRDCFALGQEKTEDQTVLFIAERQVEMIARALSPGINDPHTAISVLNWLAAGIAEAAMSGEYYGLAGTERIAIAPIDTRTLLEATFGAAYAYVAPDDLARTHWQGLMDELEAVESPALGQAVLALRASVAATGDKDQGRA